MNGNKMTNEDAINTLNDLWERLLTSWIFEDLKQEGKLDECKEAHNMAIESLKQKSKAGYISIDDVMSVFDDFMCGDVDEDGTAIFLEMLKDKAESEEERQN